MASRYRGVANGTNAAARPACGARSSAVAVSTILGGPMRHRLCLVPIALLVAGLASTAGAQDRPYTEGNVAVVSYIRIKPGMFDKYVKYLDTDYKKIMEAEKKAGVIVDYSVYTSTQEHEGDWNMVLRVIYKNMAALDNLRDRAEPLQHGVTNFSPEQAAQASIERNAMRDAVGGRVLREIILK
jgi:L-rhamnose mutarotase